jgi:hypothetical protein
MAKATTDPQLATRLIEAAADLKDQIGELPPQITRPPDVLAESVGPTHHSEVVVADSYLRPDPIFNG